MITLAVDTFKCIRAQFTLLGFEARRVHLKVCLATPGEMTIVFNLVQSITLDVPRALEATSEGGMSPLSVVLALQDSRIHIHTSNGSNITTNIKASIDECFGQRTTLRIPDVNPNNSHVQFWRDFDNSRF